MPRLVECVPNFSEGRHKEVVEAIAAAIQSTDGCSLLDVDPGASTNRTVYTFVGSPDAVVEGALNAARAAVQLIDMTRHSGEHPRFGALDVCPFIPLQDVTMEECVECAKEFGERLSMELGVPVYLYGEAVTDEEHLKYRKSLPQVRSGEYEGILDKIGKPEWSPNYGPAEFVPHWGATATGARKFLVAYNVNLLSTKEQAHRIALDIREQGRGKDQPGSFKNVQAIGWWLEEAELAQVSANITDFDVTPIHEVFEACVEDAKEMNLPVTGSQIVGLVPLAAILQAADYYMRKENLFILDESQKIRLVVDRLGLHSLAEFNPKERIIEYMVETEKEGPLVSMQLKNFIYNVGYRSAAPGGGSVAALNATMGAALGSMVGQLTYGKRVFESLDATMRRLIPPFYKTMKDLMGFIDADAEAFNDYMTALKLPKSTPDEQERRTVAMQRGLKSAIDVPMTVIRRSNELWPALKEMSQVANINCKSDLQVGARCLESGVLGAFWNVEINVKDISDEEYKTKLLTEAEEAVRVANENCSAILEILRNRKE
ncbi:formimidoyltransferase-cyclodeaminase-like isoform X2 [Tubulanus polymorphus]|uniref:formimidoyltransferase-cyclodeaminase-like isoform X2 n=1 Tax=Tubulanus polymorphus TaxID=672921 RepID=UPI003DA3DA46